MAFFHAFLYASIALFTYTLLYAWLSMAAGKSSSSPGKLRGQLVLLITAATTFGIYAFTSVQTHPHYVLLPILLTVVLLSASRIGYEKDYDAQAFAKSFVVKAVISLIAAFCIA
jgi:hypothetical protein